MIFFVFKLVILFLFIGTKYVYLVLIVLIFYVILSAFTASFTMWSIFLYYLCISLDNLELHSIKLLSLMLFYNYNLI